ncbi:MAG: LlaMI family restriction endonuclease [Alphaproteobacteria bacterium]|nr:LlaMI family restriction endonuclease [Alphaproteobacteria bacterium]
MTAKEQIIQMFRDNVKNQRPDVSGTNERHDGRTGQWLEHQFGVSSNASNMADLMGYELKNETTSKTTFGDWSANEYIFNQSEYSAIFSGNRAIERRDRFLTIFGNPNAAKHGRYSWSGEPCPKINKFNKFGQRLKIVKNNDIIAEYSYSEDNRSNKSEIVPDALQKKHLELARWYGNETPIRKRGKCLKRKLEDKFNDKGWFTCKRNNAGVYYKICFGEPMTFDNWIELVQQGIVFFDSGMYQGNARPYSEWRANNGYWDSLITETFE